MRKSVLILPFLFGLFVSPAHAQSGCTGQAPAFTFCSNNTGSQTLPGFHLLTPGQITLPGGTVLGNNTAATAQASGLINPILGIAGTSVGSIGFTNITSGSVTLQPKTGALGSSIITLPAITDTMAGFALANGGTNNSLTASNGGIVWSDASKLNILSGTATATQMLQSGASATPAWSTATWPATTAAGTLLTSASANVVTASATPVLGVPTSVQGTLGFAGATSGTAIVTALATAGTPTITLPNTTGTLADGASSPLVLSATTGNLTCPTCVTSSGGGAITGTAPVAVSAAGVVSLIGKTGTTNNVVLQNAPTLTGSVTINGAGAALAIQTGTANAFSVGANGATNPAFNVDTSTGSQVAGLNVKGAVTGGTVAIAAIDSGSTTNLSIDAKGAGFVSVGANSTGLIFLERATQIGILGSTNGTLAFTNTTSGTVTIAPPTGALGSAVNTLQAATDTFVYKATTDTLTNKTITSSTNSLGGVTPAFGSDATGDIYYNNAGVLTRLPIGNSTNVLTVTAGKPAWAAPGSGGTVTSVVCEGVTITTTGTCPPVFGFQNCSIAASVSGNNLTIALKDNTGSDPTAASPCNVWFRNSTVATGSWVQRTVTSATSFTANAGSTFGVANSTASCDAGSSCPFRIWVTLIDTGSTAVLGAIVLTNASGVRGFNPANVITTTACNACSNATAIGTMYSTATQTSKAWTPLGYLDWGSGLGTAGTYASGPTLIQTYGAGIALPGNVLQQLQATATSVTTTTSTAYSTALTQVITPTASPNLLKVVAASSTTSTTGLNSGSVGIFNSTSSTVISQGRVEFVTSSANIAPGNLEGFDAPGSTLSQSIILRVRSDGTNTTGACSSSNAGDNCTLTVYEIQG